MSFKCVKCLRVKPSDSFTKILCEGNICNFCRGKIEEQSINRETEMKRFINCENKTPILKNYESSAKAAKKEAIRVATNKILDEIALKKELEDYE